MGLREAFGPKILTNRFAKRGGMRQIALGLELNGAEAQLRF